MDTLCFPFRYPSGRQVFLHYIPKCTLPKAVLPFHCPSGFLAVSSRYAIALTCFSIFETYRHAKTRVRIFVNYQSSLYTFQYICQLQICNKPGTQMPMNNHDVSKIKCKSQIRLRNLDLRSAWSDPSRRDSMSPYCFSLPIGSPFIPIYRPGSQDPGPRVLVQVSPWARFQNRAGSKYPILNSKSTS